MEQWKISVLTGIALILLAIAFSIVRGEMSIWMILVIVLGFVDIVFGLYRKKIEK